MASIKVVNRSASAAFAPEAPYLAAGTMAGAVDLSFSSTANLDIFEVDFVSDDRQLILAGSIPSSERFNRLSWGKCQSNSEEFSHGIIAGGLVDGNIGLWNPKPLISRKGSEAIESALVGNLSRHKGPVRGLEFNGFTPNLLASGADEGEICIWDIAKPSEPSHFPPLKGSGSSTQGEISYVSWNSKVQHILASTSLNGTTVVWDLKKQKPVISFADSVKRRCSVLQWHPDVATQLIVASDEDGSPALRLWDMRNVMSPVKEFVGHTKGVIAMSWCPLDSSYLLTCAKDNRTICWDVASGEIVSELPAGTNWNFDVHWYPRCPGVISASSFDGKIGIYNIEGCGRAGDEDGYFGAAPLRAPKWWSKKKAGVSFGFGGKLVSFRATDAPTGSTEVHVHNIVTEEGLVSRSSEFETAIQNGEKTSLRVFCEKKCQESESPGEKEVWGFLKVMFEEDGDARTKLLSHLGFSLPVEEKDTMQNDISEQVNALALDENLSGKEAGNKENLLHVMDNGEDFFNNLPSPKADTPVSTSVSSFAVDESVDVKESQPEMDVQEESADTSFDEIVQRALVVGDYKGAVAQCISANRMADALVIAHVGGASLWEQTRDQYLKTSQSSYLRVVAAMVNNDLMSLVNTRPLKSWKETLALLCTFAPQDEWTSLCDTLASRLLAAGETLPATLCYICAGNIDKTIEIWSRTLAGKRDGKSYVDLLQDLMEKTIVFALATGQKRFSASLCKLLEKYAEILASQGLLTTAMEYLKLMGSEELSPELTILRDRIALSTEPAKDASKSAAFDNSQLHTGSGYVADQSGYGMVDPSQHYYPEQPSKPQPSISNSPYAENYQQPFGSSYSSGFTAPVPYQPAPQQNIQQPNIFLPTPTPSVPQGNIPPPPVATQPAKTSFIPSNPPALRNVDQYQQPPHTLGAQLYPGPANPGYPAGPNVPPSYGPNPSQVGPTFGQKMPQAVAPSQAPRGFMPVNNTVQRPGMAPMQPPSPTQPAQAQPPAAPAAPPPTVQTVDTSNVPAQQKPVIATLTRLFNETSEALGGARGNPAKKREIEDNSKKLGALFAKLNSGDISKNAAEKLVQLCQALDNGDFSTALQIQVLLTTSDWDECNFWLATLKRMIKIRQSFR
ncbi:PREDICTED: protein transport protein SEC31 homolog B isoform X1 [Nicotiana attenuata]|uniref:protein transport protein SEC31 homolog B isoform X1 n=1 Tax=Nicotiana attenuata TaxID=49451 RepID=UPI0009051E1B|nr:PREDICTED: protein transport protein SEC31 homolog B isoform X1 [Nicotiana attenuata]